MEMILMTNIFIQKAPRNNNKMWKGVRCGGCGGEVGRRGTGSYLDCEYLFLIQGKQLMMFFSFICKKKKGESIIIVLNTTNK